MSTIVCRQWSDVVLLLLRRVRRSLQAHHGSLEFPYTPFLLLLRSTPFIFLILSSSSLVLLLQPLDLFPLSKKITDDALSAEDIAVGGACYGIAGWLETEDAAGEWKEGISVQAGGLGTPGCFE